MQRVEAFTVALVVALAGATLGCRRSSGGLDSAYQLGEQTAAAAADSRDADRSIQDKLTFEPYSFQQADAADAVPSLRRECGVKYVVSSDAWGIVPDLTYPCDDQQAKQRALADAKTRLPAGSQGEYELRLAALRGGIEAMREQGPSLVYADSLGVDFDLDACVDTLSGRIEGSAERVAALQCQTFLEPGKAPEEMRASLLQAADRASELTQVVARQPAVALASNVAAACRAELGEGTLTVPGSVAASMPPGRDVAYAVHLNAGQTVDLGVTGPFDSMIKVLDAACTRELASDDDGGEGNNARLRWTSPAAADYVVVVSSYQRSGRGPYTLTASADSSVRVVTDDERRAAAAFASWVRSASPDDLAATWRGTAPDDLQLGCLNRARNSSAPIRRASSTREAFEICVAALRQATEARKEALAASKK